MKKLILAALVGALLSKAIDPVVMLATASYPGSVKSFTTKSTNDTIQATHINDIQDEVASIEGALLSTGFAHHLRAALTNTYDLGVTGAIFRDLNLGRNADIGGTLNATGATTLGSTLGVTGATTLAAMTATTGAFSGAITATGGQMVFPGTQVASVGVNTLDDYEEGTFTPTITGSGGSAGSPVYASQAGTYVKVGKLVHVSIYVKLSTAGTYTGTVQISGLPFTAATVSGMLWAQATRWEATATNWVTVVGYVTSNTAIVTLAGANAAGVGSTTGLVNADIGNTTGFSVTGTYEAAN